MKTIAFFNNKGGVGKTTLTYHIAYMFSEMGKKVLAVDLDPQANLTSMFLTDQRMEEMYLDPKSSLTIKGALRNMEKGIGDILPVHLEKINDNLSLIAGDLDLSLFEDKLSEDWSKCLGGKEPAFRAESAFYRIIQEAAESINADYVFIDIGPNFGAINRSVLISSDYLIVPTAADLFSLQGLKNIGNRLQEWTNQWQESLKKVPEDAKDLPLPQGAISPLGYVIMQHSINENKPAKSYSKWANRIPSTYNEYVLRENNEEPIEVANDKNCIALIKHYHSLMPMAMEARKPIFSLKPADGAIGAHFHSVQKVEDDFRSLSQKIMNLVNN